MSDGFMIDDLGTTDGLDLQNLVPDVSSGDGVVRTFEQCTEWAEKLNCTLRVAQKDELFIDIDTEEQYKQAQQLLGWLNGQHFIYNKWKITPSKEGLPHRHIVAKLRQPQPVMVRLALQAICGSDPVREAISVQRALREEDNISIFFEPKV